MAMSIIPVLVEQVSNLIEAIPGFVTQISEAQWLRSLDARFRVVDSVAHELLTLPANLAGAVLDVVSSSVGVLITGITVLSISAFGLLSGEALFEQSMLWVKPERRDALRGLLLEMNRAVSGYLVGAFLICALGGAMTGIITWVLGVPFFLALGLMYLVLGFIPYLGSLVVAIAVSLTTLATVGFRRALIALGLFLIYQQIEGNVLQPLIQRRTLKMNPLLIAIVVVGGAMVMGVLGAVLALPIAAALQVLLQKIQEQRQAQWELEAQELAVASELPPPTPPHRTEEPIEAPQSPEGPKEPWHH
jgi:predicted PurR-regulated permease PerM